MEKIAIEAGLSTKSSSPEGGTFQVLNRIAIEELEAWFFGDVEALVAAYPGVPRTLAAKERYRDPDAIVNAWEALDRVLQKAGYPGPLRKITSAPEISKGMVPEKNRSASFQSFYAGILACIWQS